jgi:hypothetical protein
MIVLLVLKSDLVSILIKIGKGISGWQRFEDVVD